MVECLNVEGAKAMSAAESELEAARRRREEAQEKLAAAKAELEAAEVEELAAKEGYNLALVRTSNLKRCQMKERSVVERAVVEIVADMRRFSVDSHAVAEEGSEGWDGWRRKVVATVAEMVAEAELQLEAHEAMNVKRQRLDLR